MAQISSGIGLISGLNTADIINQLIAIDSQPKVLLQSRITANNSQKQAYTDLATGLNGIQTIGNSLALPQTFQNTSATSSDQNVLTATSSVGAAVGSYQFQVSRLVTTQQSITQGFADATSAPVGAGTITLEQGGGEASSETTLASLNGGAGVQRGQFRVTDRSGNTAVIDTSDAITLDDVVKKINTSLNISVKATVTDQGLVLSDTTGKTASDLIVRDLGGGSSAKDLGIAGDVAGTVVTGTSINFIGRGTALNQLNDGRGIRTTTAGQTDFAVTLGDGTRINVSLAGTKSVGDVIDAINKAGGTKLKADFSTSGSGLRLTDTSGGAGVLSLAAQNGSRAAADLGLTAPATGNIINGAPTLAGIDSVLISSLKGGAGFGLGRIFITDRAGHTGQVDLSGATSLRDILDTINNNQVGVGVTASLNSSKTGVQIVDTSGGSGNLVIGDTNSNTAGALGIAGTFDNTVGAVNGGNLQRQYVSENTLLADYNGGQGVTPGQFQITNSQGATSTLDLSQGTFNTIGDIIQAINAKNISVTASINSNGNGILLTDTAGGANKLKVTDLGGTTAANLNIAGTASGNTIDGARQATISVSSTDTLSTLADKINKLGFGVNANILNDGSGLNPFRLSLTSYNSGRDGRVVIDGGSTKLNVSNLVDAQDAAVFLGSTGGTAQPLLVTSNKNQLTNLIKGVTVNLVGASSSPVTLSIARNTDNVSQSLQKFVDGFNGLVDKITSDTKFDTTTNTSAVLLGDQTVGQIQDTLYNVFNTVVKGAGKYKIFSDIGITITDGAKLAFDSSKFAAAFANDPTSVQNLFSQATTGLGPAITQGIQSLTDPVNGIVTNETKTIDSTTQQYQDRITQLNDLLAAKRTRLEQQFANMESVLANLQGQQQALGSLGSITASTTPTKSTSSTSSSTSSTTSG